MDDFMPALPSKMALTGTFDASALAGAGFTARAWMGVALGSLVAHQELLLPARSDQPPLSSPNTLPRFRNLF